MGGSVCPRRNKEKEKIMHKIQNKTGTNVHFNSNLITVFFLSLSPCCNGCRLIYQKVEKKRRNGRTRKFRIVHII